MGNMELTIDAKDAVVGRVATFAAKQALLGYAVNIVNCEDAIITGSKPGTHAKYHRLHFTLGQQQYGPYFPRVPDRFVRRLLRGMLEYKTGRGKDAYKRIRCYIGVPESLKQAKLVPASKTAKDLPNLKYVTVGALCRSLGGKA